MESVSVIADLSKNGSEQKLAFFGNSLNSVEQYSGGSLDLNKLVVRNGASTFYMKVAGEGMKNEGVINNDLIVVDRAQQPLSGQTVVASINGELWIKRLVAKGTRWWLIDEGGPEKAVELWGEVDVWGVVTHIIRKL